MEAGGFVVGAEDFAEVFEGRKRCGKEDGGVGAFERFFELVGGIGAEKLDGSGCKNGGVAFVEGFGCAGEAGGLEVAFKEAIVGGAVFVADELWFR